MYSKKKKSLDAKSIIRGAERAYQRLSYYFDRGTVVATMNPGEPDEHVTSIEFSMVFRQSRMFFSGASVFGWTEEPLSYSVFAESEAIFEQDFDDEINQIPDLCGCKPDAGAFALWDTHLALVLLTENARLLHPSVGRSLQYEYLGVEETCGESCHVVIERWVEAPHSFEAKLWISIETHMVRKSRRTRTWKLEYFDANICCHRFWRPISLDLVSYHFEALSAHGADPNWVLYHEAEARDRFASTCIIETTYDTIDLTDDSDTIERAAHLN